MRIGFGYDVHEIIKGRKMVIGGVEIPSDKGLLGHSDADVLIHAIMDSILGALALGDIGKHFPDTDMKYKDISSVTLLSKVYEKMTKEGYKIGNIDGTIVAQAPKMQPYIETMRDIISKTLKMPKKDINIKATTTEWLGFVGREDGISSYSVCLLKRN